MSDVQSLAITYTLDMLTNFHIGSGANRMGTADSVVLRLANNELYIPGSTIKGCIRHHCEQLTRGLGLAICGGRADSSALCKDDERICLTCRLFGSEWRPGTLRFSDAQLPESLRQLVHDGDHNGNEFDYQVITNTRTRLNRALRRVERGALYTIEEGVEGMRFTGRIQGAVWCKNISNSRRVLKASGHHDVSFGLS